jgi:hypothetical protein
LAEEEAKRFAERDEHRIEELERTSDPVERLLGALWSYSDYTSAPDAGRQGGRDATLFCDDRVLRHLLPHLWPAESPISLGTHPAWAPSRS